MQNYCIRRVLSNIMMEFYLYTKLNKLYVPQLDPLWKHRGKSHIGTWSSQWYLCKSKCSQNISSVSFQRWIFILKWLPLEDTAPYRLRVSKNTLIYFECTATFSQLFKNVHSAHLNMCTSVHANWRPMDR